MIRASVPNHSGDEKPSGYRSTGAVRRFQTGATRDTDDGKPDFEGFICPLVTRRFAQYMHKHRLQSDGTLRASDNWQAGIPVAEYMKSIYRHFEDVHLHHRGYGNLAREPLEEALCALLFNVQGWLHELLKVEPFNPERILDEMTAEAQRLGLYDTSLCQPKSKHPMNAESIRMEDEANGE